VEMVKIQKKRDLTLNCAGQACCPEGNNFGTTWDSTKLSNV